MTLEEKLSYWRAQGAPGLITPRSETRPVVAEEGKNRGKIVGTETEHWSDRKDASVTKYEAIPTTRMKEIVDDTRRV